MSLFISKYPSTNDSGFKTIITDFSEKSVLAIGQEGNAGLLFNFNSNGDFRKGYLFSSQSKKVIIEEYVAASNNDYILLGSLFSGPIKETTSYLLLRINSAGDIRWAKEIKTQNTARHKSIVRIGNDYVISGWQEVDEKSSIRIHKVNTNGELIQSKLLNLNFNAEFRKLISTGKQLVVLGNEVSKGKKRGIINILDTKLNLISTNYIYNPESDETEIIVEDVVIKKGRNIELIITGVIKNIGKNYLFITRLGMKDNQLKVIKSVKYEITNNYDAIPKLLEVNKSYYLLVRYAKIHKNYILKLDTQLSPLWLKTFNLDDKYLLTSINVRNKEELWFSGIINNDDINAPVIVKTNLELSSCKTKVLPNINKGDFSLKLSPIASEQKNLNTKVADLKHKIKKTERQKVEICPDKNVSESKTTLVQSPYLNLQCSGSMGKDASKGFLLRWFLGEELGKSHLPKGNYASNSDGYNKPDDFIFLYRAPYSKPQQKNLDFSATKPIFIIRARWIYQIQGQIYYLDFKDNEKYNNIKDRIHPNSQPYHFLKAYGNSLLELEIRNTLAFSIEAFVENTTASFSLKVETFSVVGNIPLEGGKISSRKEFKQGAKGKKRIIAENIRRIRFKTTGGSLKSFKFEMYEDFYNATTASDGWKKLGEFALSKETATVEKRLEDRNKFKVHQHWQKYNDDAYVNIDNYKAIWNTPLDGDETLSQGVEKYIELSDNIENPTGSVEVLEEIEEESKIDIHYLELLQFACLDYHIARMCGLGHIDIPDISNKDKFIYMVEYYTDVSLEKTTSNRHLYLTTPISLEDERIPQKIQLHPVTYGLEIQNGTNQPFQLSNPGGYNKYLPIRYVNINAKLPNNYSRYNGFFQPALEFSISDISMPVFMGLEYRKKGEENWRKPEISHNDLFKDSSDEEHFETAPIPFNNEANTPLFTHQERKEGFHEYAAYSIDVFSRASKLSNSVFTDETIFVKPNTLLPPSNIKVQLIQEESPLLLTSKNEQEWLKQINEDDKTLVRLSFNYAHIHDINYQYGDKVEVFFRKEKSIVIEGGIETILGNIDEPYSIIQTKTYYFNSGETVIPSIPNSIANNFKGSNVSINGKYFEVIEIIQTTPNGDYPKLKIKNIEKITEFYDENGNSSPTLQYKLPDFREDTLFLIGENETSITSWGLDNRLDFSIQISDDSWEDREEKYFDKNGELVTQNIRGIWEKATIQKSETGYEIRFNDYKLDNHPQHNAMPSNGHSVNWYKGVIRISTKNDTDNAKPKKKKVLEVIRIEHIGDGQLLKLIIEDKFYNTSDDGENIKEGVDIDVNFFPGYRVYMYKKGHLNAQNILPTENINYRNTFLGLRTIDTTTQDKEGGNYASPISQSVKLTAKKIIEPQIPKLPKGPKYTTPPDFYGKSTYTFTTEFNGETYASIYYRADVNSVLKTLYKKETLKEIKEKLGPINDDKYYTERIQDIIKFNYTGTSFTEFPLNDDSAYALPNPDNSKYKFDGLSSPNTIEEDIKKVVWETFVPITEHPLIYSLIKGGDYIPTSKKQVLRDRDDELLAQTNPSYDIAPMAKRIDENKVQFTDFTLDGEMSIGSTAYLYFVRTMGNKMNLSEPSPIIGPIQLVNTNPPEAPIIRKVTTQLANLVFNQKAAINFEINAYSPTQNVSKIEIYRSLNAIDALTPRTMTLVKTIDITEIDTKILQIQDDFEDNFIPYGESLYYKIVAIRKVKYINSNGNAVERLVPSKSSKSIQVKLVDNFNPESPEITVVETADYREDNKGIYKLGLKWNKVAHNAKYTLLKMNSRGNWDTIPEEIQSNDEDDLIKIIDSLPKKDSNGNPIYHRFKVSVENSAGLFNRTEKVKQLIFK